MDVLIPLTSSPKKCRMGHTFDGCEILSCVASPTFFSSHCWSSIISHSWPHTQIIVKWYLPPHFHIRFLHKTLISKLCVPFPFVGPSQLSPTCRALAVSSYDVFITLFPQDCFEISLGINIFFFSFFSAGLFFHHECIDPPCLAAFFCFMDHGRKDGGCYSTCTLRVSKAFPRGMPRHGTRCLSLVL